MVRETRPMRTYGQYCPIARASEILARRWTPIIVRDLLNGPTTYSKLADGAPGLSRSLLTSRLRELQEVGLVETIESGTGSLYALTPAGRDLGTVFTTLGQWGERWLDVSPQSADPGYVLNSWTTTYLDKDRLPDHRVVVRFDLTDQPVKTSRMWVVFDGDAAEVCRKYPGFEEDLVVSAESVALAEWHLGRTEWHAAVRAGRIEVTGSSAIARALPTWNLRSRWVTAEHP